MDRDGNHSKIVIPATLTTVFDDVGLIGDDIMQYIYTINFSIICFVVSIFGIVANSINITVFRRLGFKETINISLLALAISDLCSLITLLWVSICYYPLFMYADIPILTIDLQHFTGGWTHVIFTRVTGFITVFITLECFLCVVYPLKVRNILTSKRVKIIVIAIYIIVIASMTPVYSVFRLDWKYVESLNKTMFGNIRVDGGESPIPNACYYMQLFYLLFSFTAVVICTYMLASEIKEKSRWRQNIATADINNKAVIRDRQVVNVVIYVALVFIVSYFPSIILFAIMIAVPGANNGEENEHLFMLSYSFSFILEGINSSVNIFVYYKSSSRYRQQFNEYFRKDRTCTRK